MAKKPQSNGFKHTLDFKFVTQVDIDLTLIIISDD